MPTETSLAKVLDDHRVVVCVGSGGVGKTTTSAALALGAAMRGKRVLCLTIDPAKRLANSLGLKELTTEEQLIDRALFDKAGLVCEGALSALMLDTKRTFDGLVARYAPSPAQAQRILDNRIYKYVSTSLAGTQEYMAMEKLYEVKDDPRFDLVILDTPPTSNALDFLDAPERMIGFVDSPAARWFLETMSGAGKLSWRFLGKGAQLMLKGLAQFTGAEFLDEVSQFLFELNSLFGGFQERAARVAQAFRSPEIAFVVVTSPAPLAIEESLFFSDRLTSSQMNSKAFVINQVHALHSEPRGSEASLVAELSALAPEVPGEVLFEKLTRALDDDKIRAVADRLEVERLRQRTPKSSLFVEVPAFDRDVHDLASLSQVASFLLAEPA